MAMQSQQKIPPVFMFGFERSGTTLLSMMMGAHPQLAVPLTVTGLWYAYSKKLADYNLLDSEADIRRLVEDLIGEERIQLWDEQIEVQDVFDFMDEPSYSEVVMAFHRAYARKKEKPYWANLDIATLDEMNVAHSWSRNARFIHIVRDGRDVALSHETMPFGSSNTLDCGRNWQQRVFTNLKMGAMLPEGSYKVVRYEDLVLQPDATLRELCRFIGIEYSEKMLDYGGMVADKIPDHRRWLWPDLDKKPQASKCYGWKNSMSDSKRVVFEGEAAGVLHELGYETYDERPKVISAYAYELWCVLGREGRYRRLAKKFGIEHVSSLEKQWKKNHGS